MSTFPVVNINGDSVEELLAQHHAVYKQALLLKEALSKAAPHGRNYQTVSFSAYAAARDEWLALNHQAHAIQMWADTTLNDLMRQAHQRMSSQKVGEIALRVMKVIPALYLGDGVYATTDGYSIELRLNRHDDPVVVYLEPSVMDALIIYYEQLKKANKEAGR